MRENKVKRTLSQGGISTGTMVFEFNTSGIARIAASAGAEFLIFDMEHTGWSIETVRLLMATSRAADIVPMVRVPTTEYHFFSRSLDVGAMGLMVPMVENETQAKIIVDSAKYPPIGKRGAAFGIAHDDYEEGDILDKMSSINQEILLIAQIETVQGLENADKIAALDGIDVLWIGHFDLTNSMEIPGQFDHPKYLQAVTHVAEICQKHGKSAGFMASNVKEGCSMQEKGFRCLAYGGDLWLYKQALRQGISALKNKE
ncbi:TPA: aldolase [Candidatus Poribacteria bacterium]|nr:aldolase [Candidatus Poribacteria bacterium]HIO08601.1 aldolase [Candidatus Poribacteria bacterium]